MASGPRGIRLRLTLGIGLALCSVLLVEGLLRARQWLRYGTLATSFYALALDPDSGLMVPEPGSERGRIRINSLGFRGPELADPKPPGRIRIAFLGGSTTFCAEASSLEATWPERVVDGLAARHAAREFDYVNGGAAGYTTAESERNLVHRIVPLEPDVIVIYHGTNDLTHESRLQAEAQGLWSPETDEGSSREPLWLTWHLIEKNVPLLIEREERAAELLALDAAALAGPFRARLSSLIEAARGAASVVVVATFSHRVRPEQSPAERREACASSLHYMPFLSPDSVLAGFEELNRVVCEVARELDTVLVERDSDIPGDALHFRDSVHLTDAGCAKMAARVLDGIEGSAAFQELLGE